MEGESERIIRYRDVRGKKRLGRGAGVDGFDDVTPEDILSTFWTVATPGYHASVCKVGGEAGQVRRGTASWHRADGGGQWVAAQWERTDGAGGARGLGWERRGVRDRQGRHALGVVHGWE